MKHRLAIVASHVIQYQDPFFRLLAQDPEIDLTVLYCSRAGAETYRDEDMKTTLAWDIDLLQGYRYRFLRNLARDSHAGYMRLINPGIVPAAGARPLRRGHLHVRAGAPSPRSSAWRRAGSPARRSSSTATAASRRPEGTSRAKVRSWFLRRLFARATGFMVSGKLNAGYYRHYGADEQRFFSCLGPWTTAVLRRRPQTRSGNAMASRTDAVVILFSAKLVPRKDPMTLLRAFEAITHRRRAALVFMGDGELRAELETHPHASTTSRTSTSSASSTSASIPGHYAMSECSVLPSVYEPRGRR